MTNSESPELPKIKPERPKTTSELSARLVKVARSIGSAVSMANECWGNTYASATGYIDTRPKDDITVE